MCGLRALRGGSWFDYPVRERSAFRFGVYREEIWLVPGFRLILKENRQ